MMYAHIILHSNPLELLEADVWMQSTTLTRLDNVVKY